MHLNQVVFQLDMANAFNLVSKGVMFQKLCTVGGDIIQLIPFVRAFYAFESPLFYNHHNCDGNVIIIPSAMGICQGDHLGKALFVLAHLKALHFIANHFPSYLFPSIINDIHIIGPPSIISSTYEHFQIELCAIGFFYLTLEMCNMPLVLSPNFNTPSQFNTPLEGIKILGVPLGTSSFKSSFIKNILLKDVWHVDLLLRLGNVRGAFGISIHCYAQHPSYLLRCTPPFPTFINTLVSFDSSFQIFGRLLGLRSFDSPKGLLAHK